MRHFFVILNILFIFGLSQAKASDSTKKRKLPESNERGMNLFKDFVHDVGTARVGLVRKHLNENKVDVNQETETGSYPIHVAARGPRYRNLAKHGLEVLKVLLSAEANLDARDFNQATPLHWAALNPDPSYAELLVEAKADVNAVDVEGETALHTAVEKEHDQLVEYLIASKADPFATSEAGVTPYQLALKGDRLPVVEKFRDKTFKEISGCLHDKLTIPLMISVQEYLGPVSEPIRAD